MAKKHLGLIQFGVMAAVMIGGFSGGYAVNNYKIESNRKEIIELKDKNDRDKAELNSLKVEIGKVQATQDLMLDLLKQIQQDIRNK